MILAINAGIVRNSISLLLLAVDKKCVWCMQGTEVLQFHCGEYQAPDSSRGSARRIATRLRAGRSGNPGRVGVLFCSPKPPDRLWGPPSFLFVGYRGCFPGLKRPGRQVNHSPPSSAEDKNEWGCTFIPPVCLHGVDRKNFSLQTV